MHASRLQRALTPLALLAMLLLAFAPTVNRLLAAARSSDGTWIEMCTMSGLAWVKVPGGDDGGAPKPLGGMDHDCAYCPLLNALTALVWLAFALLPRLRALAVTLLFSSPRSTISCRTGLGSRGPPLYA